MPLAAFLPPNVPFRSPGTLSRNPHLSLRARTNPNPQDQAYNQYDQYKARDQTALSEQRSIVRAIPKRQRHHQIFLNREGERPFRAAALRYMKLSRENPDAHHRLWLLRSRGDPTFGKLKGDPVPIRVMVVEPVDGGVERWVEALDRAGKVLSPMPSHFVDWAVVRALGKENSFSEGELVACEILNADWRSAENIINMKQNLILHAEEMMAQGTTRLFEVFQSIDEPTCFKTVEVYRNIDVLKEHMSQKDPSFAIVMMEWRAAVNRVRQLYEPLFT